MTQKEYISNLWKENKGAVFVGSLGTISKDLQDMNDGRNMMVCVTGAMGCAMGVGLGMAISDTKKVIVLIGEGSLLMKLGSIATINRYKPKNLKIIIINNGKYASCGGQENNYEHLFSSFLPNLNGRAYQVLKVVD